MLLVCFLHSACTSLGSDAGPALKGEGAVPVKRLRFTVDEGTDVSVDVTPDQSSLFFDLLGDIYSVSVSGGAVKLIRGAESWDIKPRLAPDGRKLAFISNGDEGLPSLWVVDTDGSNARRVSDGEVEFYDWDIDSSSLIVKKRFERNRLQRYSIVGAPTQEIDVGVDHFTSIAVGPAGRYLYVAPRAGLPGDGAASVFRIDRATGKRSRLVEASGEENTASFTRLRVSSCGEFLAYLGLRYGGASLHVLSFATGESRLLVADYRSGDVHAATLSLAPQPEYSFARDGRSIYASLDGKLSRIDVATGAIEIIPFNAEVNKLIRAPVRPAIDVQSGEIEIRQLSTPTVAADGASVAFSALGKLWTAAFARDTDAAPRPLTGTAQRKYAPAFSPIGSEIAYVGYTDERQADLFIASSSGEPRNITNEPGFYMNPAWTEDGERLVFIKGSTVYARQRYYRSHPGDLEVWITGADGSNAGRITSYRRPRERNLHGFSPLTVIGNSVFFVEAGENESRRNLVSVNLDGANRRILGHFPANIDYAIPSPDGERLAVLGRVKAWVIDRQERDGGSVPIALPSAAEVANDDEAIFDYAQWTNDSELVLYSMNRAYRWEPGSNIAALLRTIEFPKSVAAPRGTLALVNARIITVDGQPVIDHGTVVVDGNRIVAVGDVGEIAVPDEAFVVDLTGKTIIPGMIDTHAHLFGDQPMLYREQKPEFLASLAYGVTSNYDAGAPTLDVFAQADMVSTGLLTGPRVFSAGKMVHGRQYATNVSLVDLDSAEDADRIVQSLVLRGAVVIKSYSQPTRQQRRWLIEAARKHDVRVTIHTSVSLKRNLEFVADGHTALEHWYPNSPLYDDVKLFVAKSGVHITPTRWVMHGLESGRYFYEVEGFRPGDKLRRFSRPEVLATHFVLFRQPYLGQELKFQDARDLVEIIRLGGKVDIGAHGDLPGLGTHQEMWLLSLGGATPLEALRAATLTGAEKLGVEKDLGSVSVGKLADLVVLNSNPLEDIRNSGDIEYVVKNGIVYHADSMTRMWPEYEPIEKPYWHSDEVWEEVKPELPQPWRGVAMTTDVNLEQATVQ